MSNNNKASYQTVSHAYEAIVVGGGGAGLRACIELAKNGISVACISKVFPTRSNTVVAQGGISAALSNVCNDDWRWHFHDTVKGSDWLGDQDAIEYMCKTAEEAVIELEHMGVPFSRTAEGKIYQRKFGGMKKENGKGAEAYRTCAVADRTGHAILHTLYQQCLKYNVSFFSEYFTIDLIEHEKSVIGALAWDLNNGDLHTFTADITILATGGYARVYENCTASHTCTGDGGAMVMRLGLPMQDMEFIQFHPTGLYPSCCLMSEAIRSEGGYLVNKNNERFMEKYAPQVRDLATRDVISRAISEELQSGRGCGKEGKYIELKASHLSKEVLETKLPAIKETAMKFTGIDISKQNVPVVPTAHYTMGGIPTNINGEVLDASLQVIQGLMSIGEAACVSVHGANRLGSNSLLDLIVFGKAAANRAIQIIQNPGRRNHNQLRKNKNIPKSYYQHIINRFHNIRYSAGLANLDEVRADIKANMQTHFGVFKDGELMQQGLVKLQKTHFLCAEVDIVDRGLVWNTNLVEALELHNVSLHAMAIAHGAINRTESRGSHYRKDYPDRDDSKWMKHSMISINHKTGTISNMSYRPVSFSTVNVKAVMPEQREY